jgi:hypothetical protein
MQGDAAYAMAIESAALAITACDLRLRPQLNEAFSEALELRGGLINGNICIASEVTAVLDDVFARVVALYSEDLVPIREHILRERAEKLLRRVLGEVGTDLVVHWPFAEPGQQERASETGTKPGSSSRSPPAATAATKSDRV